MKGVGGIDFKINMIWLRNEAIQYHRVPTNEEEGQQHDLALILNIASFRYKMRLGLNFEKAAGASADKEPVNGEGKKQYQQLAKQYRTYI